MNYIQYRVRENDDSPPIPKLTKGKAAMESQERRMDRTKTEPVSSAHRNEDQVREYKKEG